MKPSPYVILAASAFGLMSVAHGQSIDAANIEWKQSNAFNNLRLASNLENANGLDSGQTLLYNQNTTTAAPGETAGADNKYWLTSSKVTSPDTLATVMTGGKVWVVADLGAAYDLTSVRLWNFQWLNGATNLATRGASQFDILVRNSAADTTDGTVVGTPINLTSVSDLGGALTNSVAFNPGTSNPWTVALDNQPLLQAPNTDTYTGESFNFAPGTVGRFVAIRVDSHYGNTGGIGLGKVRFFGTLAPPSISFRSPADNATNMAIGGNLVATFTETVQAGTGSITIKKTVGDILVESFDMATTTRVTFSGADMTIDPTDNLEAGVEYYVQIDGAAVRNPGGTFFAGIADTTSWSFSTDVSQPTLSSTVPADNALDVLVSGNLVATFNEAVQAGTGNIVLKRTSDASTVETFDVASSALVGFATNQLTINPGADLVGGVEYYVEIAPTAVTDLSGNAFAGITDTTSWSFTADGTAPVPVSVSPAGLAGPHVGTRLLAQFNEPVQVGSGTVTLHKASDNSVVESINVSTPGAVVNFGRSVALVRSVVLDPATAYYVNAPAGAVLDLSGNPMAAITGTSAWAFTTSSAVPLVVENFSGSGSSLSGTSADVFDAAITTAGGSAVWGAGAGFLENGAVGAATNSNAFLNIGSYINNAKGQPDGKFELTLTIAEGTTAWVSLGFNASGAPDTALNFTQNSGVGTIIYRGQTPTPNISGEIDMFGGFANQNGVDGPDLNTGFRTLTATLDLTGHNGTTNFGSVSWSDSVLGPLGSYTFPSNRNFGSLIITQAVTSSAIDGLAFYRIAPPANSYAAWIGGFSVGGLTGIDDDFDKDGLANAVENLLGSSPEVFSPGLTNVSSNAGNLVFRHTRSATPATDLTGSYEWSTDMGTWHASGIPSGGTTVTFAPPVVITPGIPDLVEVTATVTGAPASKVFARFRATQN